MSSTNVSLAQLWYAEVKKSTYLNVPSHMTIFNKSEGII